MAPAGFGRRGHSRGVPSRPLLGLPPSGGVSRGRPEGMLRRAIQPPAGFGRRGHSRGVPSRPHARTSGRPRPPRSRGSGDVRRSWRGEGIGERSRSIGPSRPAATRLLPSRSRRLASRDDDSRIGAFFGTPRFFCARRKVAERNEAVGAAGLLRHPARRGEELPPERAREPQGRGDGDGDGDGVLHLTSRAPCRTGRRRRPRATPARSCR